jgi:hypothetical protein
MSYSVTQGESSFYIKEQDVKGALKALKDHIKLSQRYQHGSVATKWPHISLALKDLGFQTEYNEDGDLIKIYYESEKSWGEQDLLKCLAPFVQNKSFVEFLGEDGERWRYWFNEGKLWVQHPEISWGDPEPMK